MQPYDYFSSLVQTAPGQSANTVTPGVPTETDFLKLQTQLINPDGATEDDIFVSPLPMTGAYTTPLDLTDFSSATRAQIGFRLSRMVARFDIVNVAEESRFTVESISMSNGRSASRFFPIEPLKTKDETNGDLITYPERKVKPDMQKKPTAAEPKLNITQGAFYTWPSLKDDGGYLILKGMYDINMTESQPVSYKIPFKQMVNGVGTYIEVNYNHRYTIEITKVDPMRLEVNLKVTDWEEDVELDDYTPDNDFDRNTPLTLETGAVVRTNPTANRTSTFATSPKNAMRIVQSLLRFLVASTRSMRMNTRQTPPCCASSFFSDEEFSDVTAADWQAAIQQYVTERRKINITT